MRILSRKNHVLWVNYHGTRRPEFSRLDLRGAWSALLRAGRGVQPISSSMVQLTPLVIPGARHSMLRRIHARLLIAQIRKALQAYGDKPLQIWSFAPDVPYLVGAFDDERFVYYCVDDYTKFECHDRAGIEVVEADLLRRADVVITTSEALRASKATFRPDANLVRHGVDYEHFAKAWKSPPPLPADLASIPRPILGFFGLIRHWIDVKLLADVARLRPHYSFVLIGEARTDVSAIADLSNVFLLGRRPYAELPAYCAAFEAGLLPFARNDMTQNINPIKMQEYLAAGLPIVSTELPEARRVSEAAFFGNTADEFAKGCDAAIAVDSQDRRARISGLVASESWESRVEFLSQLIAGHSVQRGANRARGSKSPGEVGSICSGIASTPARA